MTKLYKVAWALWIVGTAIIGASWLDVITPAAGWIGVPIALAGTLLSMFSQRQQKPAPPPELADERLAGD